MLAFYDIKNAKQKIRKKKADQLEQKSAISWTKRWGIKL